MNLVKLALSVAMMIGAWTSLSASPMQCTYGQPVSSVVGFEPSAVQGLYCEKRVGGCYEQRACPQLSPAFCKKGRFVTIIKGYSIVDARRKLVCPQYEGACVDQDHCPQGGPIPCPQGSHAVYLNVGFEPNRMDPTLKCFNNVARCVADTRLACPMP